MEKLTKILILFYCFLCFFCVSTNFVYASDETDFWGAASTWFKKAEEENASNISSNENIKKIMTEFNNMISTTGTFVIFVATVVLGMKFIFGSVESKTEAKDGLVTLLVACVFFFGWSSIWNILVPGKYSSFIFTSETQSYKAMIARLFVVFSYVGNIVAILLVIYVGVRYILAGASGRAELKAKSGYFIIGIILTFATTQFLSFVTDIINDTLTK